MSLSHVQKPLLDLMLENKKSRENNWNIPIKITAFLSVKDFFALVPLSLS
jgi:hypothetical protein